MDRVRNNYIAACIRALRTAIQTLIGVIGTSLVTEIDWGQAVAIVATATIVSLLMGISQALPEVEDL